MSKIRKFIDSHVTELNGKYYACHKRLGVVFQCDTFKAARLVYIDGQRQIR